MEFIPILLVLTPLFLSPLFYPWPVIFGFLATIVLVPFVVIMGNFAYQFMFVDQGNLSDVSWHDIIFSFKAVWLFTFPGIAIYFVFIIPIYTMLVKYVTAVSIYYTFPIAVAVVMITFFSWMISKPLPLEAYVMLIVCSIVHSTLALWMIGKFTAYVVK